LDLLTTRRGAAVIIAGIALLFFALRFALLFGRDPFFDEMFTAWIVRLPFRGILDALRHDSGPPLYYLIVHALGLRSVLALRVFSLVCASASAALIIGYRPIGVARFTAGALLAVYPPAVLLAVDARAYALCALFVTAGILLLDRGRVYAAAIAFVLAAYTHYYGALFFPLLLIHLDAGRRRPGFSPAAGLKPGLRPLLGFILAVLLFLPALYLALHQPPEATMWLTESVTWLDPLTHVSFAATYPASLFAPSPRLLIVIALIALLVAVARSFRFGAAVIIPLLIASASLFTPRHIYFPMRFESVIAPALVLWLGCSLLAWRRAVRATLVAILMIIGVAASYIGINDHMRRPLDPYREAAIASANQDPSLPIVASGYCYLEAVAAVKRPVIPFPPDQGLHPGWRGRYTKEQLTAAGSTLPAGTFLYVAERQTREVIEMSRMRHLTPLYTNQSAIVILARPKP
jgi:hypothetical protein